MNKINNVGPSRFQYRYLARFIIEAVTPLSVGSGKTDLLTDAPVALDVNGLPYIPGTSIAGVIRHQLDELYNDTDDEWGTNSINNVSGSNIIFTEARILNSEGKVMDGMHLKVNEDDLLKKYQSLPIRQHVRITEKGVAAEAGKFDEEVVYAGSRFCFEVEWLSTQKDDERWYRMISELQAPSFRLGSGTRCGFGKMVIVGNPLTACLDLKDPSQLSLYLNKSSELQASSLWPGWKETKLSAPENATTWVEYQIQLHPQDLFLFAAPGGDEKGYADTTSVRAQVVKWDNGKGDLVQNQVLIPASSVKGAISHRVAYHYNRLTSVSIDLLKQMENSKDFQNIIARHTGGRNTAVRALFGSEGIYAKKSLEGQTRGNTIFSDVIMTENGFQNKLVNHVMIDDFTGAAIEGNLFTEQPLYGKGATIALSIYVNKSQLEDKNVKEALECTFDDLCQGYLPLGGGICKGYGLFNGSWKEMNYEK